MRNLIPALALMVAVLAGCQSGPSPQEQAEQNLWVSQVLHQIALFKTFPEEARVRNLHGIVKVAFVLDAKGNLLRQRITEHSGSPLFLAVAQQIVTDASPMPAPPSWVLENGEIEVVAPFVFVPGEDPCGLCQ
ncbi:iron ABC transporter substrate-binding protein [Pseudomonas sp. 02C 26]|uniref:TonB family protein n=1 Tax=Pseudomonas TaxID=286 RepID=UPI000C6CEE76|nr:MULTISPECIES: TonB family protein [Pseudomonas]AUF97025.1 iron ABC transporter substrate-binding protein [Pseudomonas sp. 02C 26]